MDSEGRQGAPRGAINRVAESVRDAIARGRFQAGERIYQDEIARELGVSRQPVRQAFQRLQAEGLLTEVRPGRLVVSKFSPSEVIDNISLRALLEPHAAILASRNITPEQIADLRRYNRLITEDSANKMNWNYEFHKTIAVASGSRILASFIDRLWSGMPNSPMSQALREDTAGRSAGSHEMMIDCLARGDGDGVQTLMEEHIDHTMQYHLRRSSKQEVRALASEKGRFDAL